MYDISGVMVSGCECTGDCLRRNISKWPHGTDVKAG